MNSDNQRGTFLVRESETAPGRLSNLSCVCLGELIENIGGVQSKADERVCPHENSCLSILAYYMNSFQECAGIGNTSLFEGDV